MSTRRRLERKERKSSEWCERLLTLALFNGNKQQARNFTRAYKKVQPDPYIRARKVLDAIWDDPADFLPWDEVLPQLQDDVRHNGVRQEQEPEGRSPGLV